MCLGPERYGKVLVGDKYYPYGKVLREYRPCGPNRYLSTYHERDAETGYDNRGARLYDNEIGRFLGVDPLASKFKAWSPYNYVVGNPIFYTDPKGASPEGGGVELVQDANGGPLLVVSATVYIYGDASSSDLAAELSHQVHTIWNSTTHNSPTAKRNTDSPGIPVQFDINFVHVTTEEVTALAESNTDPTVNFMRITNADPTQDGSRFGDNTGILNLEQNRTRGGTTVAHEIGHMLGFDSGFSDDNTHFTDLSLEGAVDNNQRLSGSGYEYALPLMYSGSRFIDNLGGRMRTQADVQGLGLDRVLNNATNYIGGEMTNKLK